MTKILDTPAYPCGDHRNIEPCFGKTLRDEFAGQALPVIYHEYRTTAEVAKAAYHMADAMLAERVREDTSK